MAQLIRINSLGLVNFHRYQHQTTRAIVIVECSDREYADLALKGAGPPPIARIPNPKRDYKWIGSQGGADKFAAGKYRLDLGEMYSRGNRFYIRPHDVEERIVVTDPTRDTITGDTTSRDTTITISPDPVRARGGTWRVVGGDMVIR